MGEVFALTCSKRDGNESQGDEEQGKNYGKVLLVAEEVSKYQDPKQGRVTSSWQRSKRRGLRSSKELRGVRAIYQGN